MTNPAMGELGIVPPGLTPGQLLQGYADGVFPMAPAPDSGELRWYDPPRRGILPLDGIHLSRSLAKILRAGRFSVTVNTAFAAVMEGCATVGLGGLETRSRDTWISPRIVQLYGGLHARGNAHSVEVWNGDGALVGGVYGVSLGRAFFGESMFSRVTNASKVALAHLLARLVRQGYTLCDNQYPTPHLAMFGGIEIPRAAYKKLLAAAIVQPAEFYSASVSSGTGSSVAGAGAPGAGITGAADVTGAEVAALLAGAASAAG